MPIDKILKNIQGNPAVTGALSGAAGGALVTAFANKKTAKTLLKTGGLMAVGGLAWQAYQSYASKSESVNHGAATADSHPPQERDSQEAVPGHHQPVPLVQGTEPPAQLEQQQFEQALLPQSPDNAVGLVTSAMIAAAHADGQLTEDEKQRIWQHAISTGLASEELAALATELEKPCDVSLLVEQADSFEKKLEVYSASLLVIEDDCVAGTAYLQTLGAQLQLPGALIQALHQQAGTQVAA